MGKLVLDHARLVINGVDLSDHCASIVMEDDAEDVDITGFSSSLSEAALAGFKDIQVTATFYQDYDPASVHRVLQPLYDTGATFSVEITPDATLDVAEENPRFLLTSRLFDYSPLDGLIGDPVDFEVEFYNASPDGLTMDVGPVAVLVITEPDTPDLDPDGYEPGSLWIEVM